MLGLFAPREQNATDATVRPGSDHAATLAGISPPLLWSPWREMLASGLNHLVTCHACAPHTDNRGIKLRGRPMLLTGVREVSGTPMLTVAVLDGDFELSSMEMPAFMAEIYVPETHDPIQEQAVRAWQVTRGDQSTSRVQAAITALHALELTDVAEELHKKVRDMVDALASRDTAGKAVDKRAH